MRYLSNLSKLGAPRQQQQQHIHMYIALCRYVLGTYLTNMKIENTPSGTNNNRKRQQQLPRLLSACLLTIKSSNVHLPIQ